MDGWIEEQEEEVAGWEKDKAGSGRGGEEQMKYIYIYK